MQQDDAEPQLLDWATLAENADSFFVNFFEPQCGQGVPCQRLERTRTSLSFPHFSQTNS
jgi:hypothetical protein